MCLLLAKVNLIACAVYGLVYSNDWVRQRLDIFSITQERFCTNIFFVVLTVSPRSQFGGLG